MEAAKETKEEKPTKTGRLLLVVGVDEVSKQFMFEALVKIISMCGYSVNTLPFKEIETEEVLEDFHVLIADEFDGDLEAKSSLIFSSFRKTEEVVQEIKHLNKMVSEEFEIVLGKFYQLAKWMRTAKLAYCMDYNSTMNEKGLHNYNNLRNIILPMNYAFQRDTINGEPIILNKVKPVDLIEALVPQLKEMSKVASEKFDEEVEKRKEEKEKTEDGKI